MRKVIKGRAPNKLSRVACQTSLGHVISSRNLRGAYPVKISGTWYRGAKSDVNSVIYHLNILYLNKCAFCESLRTNLDVDHYRPKGSVNEDSAHSGYYWICYEWSNLLYVCKDCNQDYKRTHFPISEAGVRFTDHGITTITDLNRRNTMLDALNDIEHPILLNPEENDFDPNEYFKFYHDGSIEYTGEKNDENRGHRTIEICDLDRYDLKESRNKELFKFSNMFKLILISFEIFPNDREEQKGLMKKCLIDLEKDDIREYTAFWNQVYLFFGEMILERIPIKEGHQFFDVIRESFEEKFEERIIQGEIPDFLR